MELLANSISYIGKLLRKIFLEVVDEVFHNSELSDCQYNWISVLHKGGDRDNIRDWRPITLLNTDYKIMSKLLANRAKLVLRKLIHSDQKGFVEGGILVKVTEWLMI
jgi:hypothetical protein